LNQGRPLLFEHVIYSTAGPARLGATGYPCDSVRFYIRVATKLRVIQ